MTLLANLRKDSTLSQRAKWLGVLGASLLVVPGCGIPKLRNPLCGPSLPASYESSSNWGAHVKSWYISSAGENGQGKDGSGHASLFDQETKSGQERLSYFRDPSDSEVIQTASFKVPLPLPEDATGSVAGDQKLAASEQQTYELFEAIPVQLQAPETSEAEAGGIDLPLPESGSTKLASNPKTYDESTTLELTPLPEEAVELSGKELVCGTNAAMLSWDQFFNDPSLSCLIHLALTGNQELRILNEEIQIANAEVQARRGEYLPFLNFRAGADVAKPSLYTPQGAVEEQLLLPNGEEFPDPLPNFLVAADIRWEIDIWKKLRNARRAAAMRFLGSQEGRNYIVTRLIADVAADYYELLALDNRLATLDKTIEIQKQSLQIAEAKKAAGRGTELAVQRFEAEVRKNESMKLIIQQQIVEAENKINFNVGRFPQPVERTSVDYIDLNLHPLSAGVPAELLQNRFDIREAERELAAANLDIKVARARFYPSFGIRAGVGFEALNPRYLLLTPESLIYNVAGDLVAPVINKAAIKADYRSANSKQLQAVYNYQRTILEAYTEVVNRLAKVENYGESIELKRQQLAALEASVDSANKLFQSARAEYVEVLLAQREMMEARMELIETKQEQLSATISAYQALGGGRDVSEAYMNPGQAYIRCE